MYYGLRFMGVYINDPATGEVISQFPASVSRHPSRSARRWPARSGATNMVALWAVLGLMAVYFFGARLIGRLPACFAVGALALNVIEVWYGRYPNTEVVMQALLFAALLALARGTSGRRSVLRLGGGRAVRPAVVPAAGLRAGDRRRRSRAGARAGSCKTRGRAGASVLTLAVSATLALAYYRGPMWWYSWQYRVNLPSMTAAAGLGVLGFGLVLAAGSQRRHFAALGHASAADRVRRRSSWRWPLYALFLREPGGKLTDYDAYALRTFREAYVFWPALIAAIAGYAMVARREFWRDPAFFLIFAAFSVFFFYKIRVVPEQFWMARRFLPIILPGTLLMASAAVFGSSTPEHRRTVRRAVAAILFMSFVGGQYVKAAAPVAKHVEYKGAIRQIDQLAHLFTDSRCDHRGEPQRRQRLPRAGAPARV